MRRSAGLIAMGLSGALVVAACGSSTPSTRPAASPAPASSGSVAPSPSPSASSANEQQATIPQPDVADLPVRPEAERVDLAMPIFSNPAAVTNPLFPVASQASVLLLGQVDDQPFRTEVTLLPETRIIQWNGQQVEVLVSQYVAYLDGRIHEVAYDYYAQADDGSVWYFGEDVFNFADGAIVDTHGTWIAGTDGPAAMIMPAQPKVGDVYRPENIPGLVFEEVVVMAVDESLDGPFGPIDGGLVVEELHMDGTREDKTFAPGYGEFYTASDSDVEALALAVPTDAISQSAPTDVKTLETAALAAFDAAGNDNWESVNSAVTDVAAGWDRVQAGEVPRLVEPILDEAIQALTEATDQRNADVARQAAIDVARSSLDMQLRHRPVPEVDLARFDLWLAQVLVDAATEDAAGMRADFFSLDYVRDRIVHTLEPDHQASVNLQLEELLGAVTDEDFEAATDGAVGLRETLAGL